MNDGPEGTLWRCEERLRRAEERLRLMEESVKDYAILHTDTEGVVTFWSEGAERVFGYSEPEVLGRPSDVLFTPEDREAGVPRRELGQAEATGHGEDVRWHLRKDGTPVFLNGVVTPLRDGEGGLRGFAKVARDVTERRRVEEKLREGEERARAILESITDAFFALDRGWRFTYVNRRAEILLGRSRADLLGKVFWEEYPDTVGNEIERYYRRGMEGGETLTFENFFPPHGRWYENHHYPSPEGLSVYFRDVTERRRQEELLREGDERLRLATEATGLGTWDFDPQTGVVVTSEIGKAAFGLSPGEELTYEKFLEAVPPGDRERVHRTNQEALEGIDGGRYAIEYQAVGRVDGIARWVEARGQAYFDEQGRAVRFLGTLLDITGRKREEERVRREREWLSVTLSSIGDAVIAADGEGRVVFMNPVAEGLTGWTQGEAAGRPLGEVFGILNEQTRRPAESPVDRVLREGVIVGLANHTVVISRAGTETAIEDSAAPIRDASGGIIGVVLVFRDATEQRRHEAALRESEGRHRAILESIGDGFFALDRAWRFAYANPQAERILGRKPGDLLGRSLWEEYPGLAGSEFERAYRRAAEERVAVSFSSYYPDHDRWYDVRTYPAQDGLSVYFQDITERERAEEEKARLVAATEQQRRIYETALSSTPDFNYVFDLDGRFTYANAALLAIWRKGPDEVLGRDFFDLGYSHEEAALHRREIQEVIRTKQPIRAETPFTSHLGERQYEYIFMPVLGAGGAVEAVVGSTRDITERKRHEEELKASGQFLASSIDALTAHIAVLDEDGIILMVNGAWRRFATGNAYPLGDCGLGINYLAACDGDGDDHCQGRRAAAGIRAVLGGRSESFQMEYPCHGPDERRWFLMRATSFESAGSVRAVVAHENITERKLVEEQLQAAKEEAERANMAKDHFLAVLSHELRTPLNPILLAASSMLERTPEPEELRPTLEMIRQNVKLQARLIDDLLDVMRIVQGKMPLHRGVSDCHALIEQSIQICRSDILGKTLVLELDLSAERHHVNADSARLHQVLWNLVRNAVKFTPEGGKIAVRTRNKDNGEGQVIIEVADTGIGIEPDVIPTIWDPFQQGETTITRRFGGLGLGLAICKGVVDAHGGTLQVESEGSGQGTTFRVVLKTMAEPPVEAQGGSGEVRSLPPLNPLNILLVEDEAATLRLMARLLKGLGHWVTAAGTVADAWVAFQAGDFEMIVSDIGLPDGTGLDLMRKVKAVRRVPAIALTGYGMDEDVRRSREAGFTTHMTKPIDFTKLEAMIRQVAN